MRTSALSHPRLLTLAAAGLALAGCGKKLDGRYELSVTKLASTCKSDDLISRFVPGGGKMQVARLEPAKSGDSLTMTPANVYSKAEGGYSFVKSADLPVYAITTHMGQTGPDYAYLESGAKVAPAKVHVEVKAVMKAGGEGFVEKIDVSIGACSGKCELQQPNVDVTGAHIENFNDLGAPCTATFERRGKHLEEP